VVEVVFQKVLHSLVLTGIWAQPWQWD